MINENKKKYIKTKNNSSKYYKYLIAKKGIHKIQKIK